MIPIKEILGGDFLEWVVWFANGTTVSLSEYDGVHSQEEAAQRARRISIAEGRGFVVKIMQTASPDGEMEEC